MTKNMFIILGSADGENRRRLKGIAKLDIF